MKRGDENLSPVPKLPSDDQFRVCFENAGVGMALVSASGRIVRANRAFQNFIGYDEAELEQKTFPEITYPEDVDNDLALFEELRSGRSDHYQIEKRYIRADGRIVWGRLTASLTGGGDAGYAVGVVEDYTERIAAEKEIRHLATFPHFNPSMVIEVNHACEILYRNPASYHLEEQGISDPVSLIPAQWRLSLRAPDPIGDKDEVVLVELQDRIFEVTLRYLSQFEALRIYATEVTERIHAQQSVAELNVRLLRAQEEERKRLARELHDTTAQSLAALTINLSRLNTAALSENERQVLAQCMDLAQQSVRELRSLSYLLHPPILDQVGLVAGLKQYVDGFTKRSGIKVVTQMPDFAESLPKDYELAIFRIVQESLSNVMRHSGSESAEVRLHVGAEVSLEVQDFGQGFDLEILKQGKGTEITGVGIRGMTERIHQLGGELVIESSPTGTTVRAVIPLETKLDAKAENPNRRRS